MAFVVNHQGYSITTEAGNDQTETEAGKGLTAHETLQRARLLDSLSSPAQRLYDAILAFPSMREQCLVHANSKMLELSFHMDGNATPAFHLNMLGSIHLQHLKAHTSKQLIEDVAWRFHVLAYGSAWCPDAQILRWSIDDDRDAVLATHSIQARILYAVRACYQSCAMKILFHAAEVPIWANEDRQQAEYIMRKIFKPTS